MKAPSSVRGTRRRTLILGSLLIGLAVAGLGWIHVERNVHRVTLRPGESTFLTVRVPMHRAFHSREYVDELNQPVQCALSSPGGRRGVWVVVAETGHGIHKMWARLAIRATAKAEPGRHRRDASFTISGDGNWPEAIVIIRVEPLSEDEPQR